MCTTPSSQRSSRATDRIASTGDSPRRSAISVHTLPTIQRVESLFALVITYLSQGSGTPPQNPRAISSAMRAQVSGSASRRCIAAGPSSCAQRGSTPVIPHAPAV